ncbi:hypothetical protein DSOL_4403 [Desulfosporosinus metallidurans]|uniref:Uncharacterized protein n=1 Tax=Desulfosporosinus metallidurans TaxID=1888891 RepID=A0A1Q8QK80_9FIRM|nr:hypothetical protein DSOL_4403 [Desulfosporosinus metallidurans]
MWVVEKQNGKDKSENKWEMELEPCIGVEAYTVRDGGNIE